MRRAAYSSGEDLCRRDERGSIWPKVEEELGEDVEGEQVLLGEVLPGEAKNAEDDSENTEAHDLDGFAAELVDSEDSEPVAWESACAYKYDLANGGMAKVDVEVVAVRKTHDGHERGRTES